MPALSFVIALVAAVAYLLLLGYAVRSALRLKGAYPWLAALTLLSFLASLTRLFAEGPVGVYLDSASLVVFGALSLVYLKRQRSVRWWLPVGALWLAALFVADLTASASILGQRGWLGDVFIAADPAGVWALLGWVMGGAVLLAVSFHAFYAAHLPELANRALFWSLVVPVILMGLVLGTSGSPLLTEVGWVIRLVGVFGATYGVAVHRIFDIRRALRQASGLFVFTLMTSVVILAAMIVAQVLGLNNERRFVVLAALAFVVAALYVPLNRLFQEFTHRALKDPTDPALALRRYSQRIGTIIELEDVARTAMQALVTVLRVRSGGLILATSEDGKVLVEPMLIPGETGSLPDVQGEIDPQGPIYRTLFVEQMPLLQFDVEFSRDYQEADPEERHFFEQMRMSAYAPIMAEGKPVGILASGAKLNDQPFHAADLDLLAALATQTGIALRNARLVTDLRRLNLELEDVNRDLARLDSVKTDFITVASHELRTPLAQIRGYTDIIEGLNEQGILDPDQMTGLTHNLRKAAERMEELISAMLDVSKIDVNAMDLRFAQTTLEAVMRLAIEPLTEAIRTRKLTLSARGLRGLPPVEADMQRLVQAFRNVIVNAVKYTPDGGLIDIRAGLEESEDENVPDEIHVTIADSGIGIDPANCELIFQKFFRAADPGLHSTGATKFMGAGPGLGLTIARGIIEGHGGRIWAESPGYDPVNFPGSTFHILLPIHPPADAKRVLPFEEPTVPSRAGSASPVLPLEVSEAGDVKDA